MSQIFKSILVQSVVASVLIALVLLLKIVAFKRLDVKWQYFAHALTLIPLFVPLHMLFPFEGLGVGTLYKAVAKQNTSSVYFAFKSAADVNASKAQVHISELLPYVWLIGACIYLSVVLLSYLLYCKRMKKYASVHSNECVGHIKNMLRIKQNIRVRISPKANSPLLVGVIFPTVYLPERITEEDIFYLALMHELTHLRRGDIIMKWAFVFACALHWFNPLSHLICKSFAEVCELCCDADVVKRLSLDEKKKYMKTILYFAEGEK